MKKGQISRCPYCGKIINYFYLYDCKRYDFGYCSHCGGMFAVKYSPVAYLLVLGAVGALAGGFAYWYLANKTIPGYSYLALCAVVALGVYFMLPFFISPRKIITRGRLGGFPSPAEIPEYRTRFGRRRKKAPLEMEPLEVTRPTEIIDLNKENTNSNTEVKIYKKENKNSHIAPSTMKSSPITTEPVPKKQPEPVKELEYETEYIPEKNKKEAAKENKEGGGRYAD